MFFFFLFGSIVDILIGIDEFSHLSLFSGEDLDSFKPDEDLLDEPESLDNDLLDDDFPDEALRDDPDFLDERECLDAEFLGLSDSPDFEELLDFPQFFFKHDIRLVSNCSFRILFLVLSTSDEDLEESLELLLLLLWGLDCFFSFSLFIYEYYTIIMN